jgi:hypothetical protein
MEKSALVMMRHLLNLAKFRPPNVAALDYILAIAAGTTQRSNSSAVT